MGKSAFAKQASQIDRVIRDLRRLRRRWERSSTQDSSRRPASEVVFDEVVVSVVVDDSPC